MKTKEDGVAKAFDPYTEEEVDLILSLLPTHDNVKKLAKCLGRTEDAIYVIFNNAYSGNWLKGELKKMGPHQDNLFTKIAAMKKNKGIFVGHQSK